MVINKTPNSIFLKYSDFANIFFPELAIALFKYTKINDYAIELIVKQQPLYGPIYSLKLIELKILKTYIKTNLANGLSGFLIL